MLNVVLNLDFDFDKKQFTQTAELTCPPKSGGLRSNSPRLWNLLLTLSKGQNAKKIELKGVFFKSHTIIRYWREGVDVKPKLNKYYRCL